MRTPSVSTPRSCVPSAEKVTFSTRSALTNLRKSEYRTSTGAPPLLWITGMSDAGAAGAGASSIAMYFGLPLALLLGMVWLIGDDGTKAETDLLKRKVPTSAIDENFMLYY